METNRLLSILRNPYGCTEDEIRQARREAAKRLEMRLDAHTGNLPPCDVKGRACEGCEFKPCPIE